VPRQLEASSGQAEAQLAQAFDATGDLIARLKPFAVGTWDLLAEDYALRCAGVEDISSLDRHDLRGEADQLSAVENHVVGVPVLALDAVDPGLQA
jgi:hypothetical protein